MAITAALAAARTSGLVPLSVFLDAISTASDETTREFHEVYFEWEFGDSGAGNWPAISNMPTRSKNEATGPLAHHVFETAGVYTVTLRVFDGVSYDEETVEITATDWEEGVTGTTLVVAHDGNFTGAPSHAQESSSTDFDSVINTNIATRKRILFKRGGTYTSSADADVDVQGPGIIGTWGSGDKPVVEHTGDVGVFRFRGDFDGDWRIMDFECDGNSGSASFGVRAWEQNNQALILRCDFHHFHVNVSLSPFVGDAFANAALWDQWAIIDCTMNTTIGGSGGNGVYIGAQRFAFQGNMIDDTTAAEHCSRWPCLTKAVISHNTLDNPADAKLTVKMQAWQGFGVNPSDVSEYIVISNNRLQTRTAWCVVLGPQDTEQAEVIRHVIVERNFFAADPAQQIALFCMSEDHTVRNNVFVLTGGATGVDVGPFPGASHGTRARIHCYQNTFYSSSGSFTAMSFSGSDNLAYNNLGYGPSGSSMVSGSGVTSGGNSSSVTTDPSFVSGSPANMVDFQIGGGSYAVGAGQDGHPVFDDAFGSARDWQTPNTDIGFHAFTEGAFPWEEAGEFNPSWATSANPQGVLA